MKVHIMLGMNKLPIATHAKILSMLCAGASMRSVSRATDTSINTVSKLLEDAGSFCAGFHDAKVRNVKARRVQVDEVWSFTDAKQKNVPAAKAAPDGAGDTWTWTAIEADTKYTSLAIAADNPPACLSMILLSVLQTASS
jgi:hypothetical protein